MGSDTGLASARSKVFEGLPTAGLPYALSGWDAFEEYMETLITSNTIESIREVWWDIRPHPNFGTVELRICDGIPTLDEISVIAAMAQSLVESFDRQLDKGYTLPQPRMWLVRENKWRAARYGLGRRDRRRRPRHSGQAGQGGDPRSRRRPRADCAQARLCRRAHAGRAHPRASGAAISASARQRLPQDGDLRRSSTRCSTEMDQGVF